MASFLSNPRVVIPLAVASAIFLGYRVAPSSIDRLWQRFAATPSVVVAPPSPVTVTAEVPLELSRLGLMLRERWLPERWRQFSTLGRDPFVGYVEEVLPLEPLIDDEIVVVDAEMLDSYIAEHVGLDENGFFVRFGTIRKREGDTLHSTEGTQLVVGSIAMAEQRRTPREHAEVVERTLSSLRLRGVMRLDSDKSLQTQALGDNGFREGEVVSSQAVRLMQDVKIGSSAMITGGRRADGLFAQGDLVTINPALGLSLVAEDSVFLVDRYGMSYVLQLQ